MIIREVALEQALKYVSRVPIMKNTSDNVLTGMCKALKQYFVPPDECVLFEGDKRRELYIIVKGYCNVRFFRPLLSSMRPKEERITV